MTREIEESLDVKASPDEVYAAVSDFRKMAEWSPEFLGAWFPRGRRGVGASFVGFNRRGPAVWFTSGRITTATPVREFAFRVTSFGVPVAQWGYRMQAGGEGTRLTEYWKDLRPAGGPRARFVALLSLVFTAVPAAQRAERNRAGMKTTLARLKEHLEATAD